MKILVTGGSGFIGSHIVDLLLRHHHEVIIYDIDSPKYDQKCEYVRGDILDIQRLHHATKDIEIIYNLAAEANVNRFYESPFYSNAVTSQGVLNILEAAKINQISRVIQASTEWIYGSNENDDAVVTEETPYAQDPDHLYTSSKIAAEQFIKNYKNLYGVDFTILRFGIPYGERGRPATVTPIFLNKILQDKEITIHGDGSQSRQFIYVKDLAAGNVAALSKTAINQIFNINGPQQIQVIEIVRTLEEILNKKAKVTFIADRLGNYKGRYISSDKAKKLLKWEPSSSYKDALEQYVNWFTRNNK